jgi:hypothetical protein
MIGVEVLAQLCIAQSALPVLNDVQRDLLSLAGESCHWIGVPYALVNCQGIANIKQPTAPRQVTLPLTVPSPLIPPAVGISGSVQATLDAR